jgi:hypothetical protein
MFKKSLLIFSILICTFLAIKASAQIQGGDISIEISPKYPKLNEVVNISLSTFTTDLNMAKISWVLDGKTVLEGVGKKSFLLTFNNSTSSKNLEVKIETISGSVINKNIVISPSDIEILWEASNTYSPPFYKGKTLAPVEGNIKVVAIPNTTNPAGFNYQWKQDNKNKVNSSGYEKSSYFYKNSYLEKNNSIEVIVSDLFGNSIGSNKIVITPTLPKVIFYEKNLLTGTRWEKSLSGGIKANKNGTIIKVEPYFFSQENLDSPLLAFNWFLNEEKITTPKQKNTLLIKPEEGDSGSSTITVVVNNISTLFQEIEKKLYVTF